MNNKTVITILLYAGVLFLVWYFVQLQQKRKMYYEYVSNLGFGQYWLDQMSTFELETLYKYIHDFTQKGIAIYYGHPLYNKLTNLAKKYPALFPYGIKE